MSKLPDFKHLLETDPNVLGELYECQLEKVTDSLQSLRNQIDYELSELNLTATQSINDLDYAESKLQYLQLRLGISFGNLNEALEDALTLNHVKLAQG